MGILGLSFGSKKNKVDQTSNINKTETANQVQTGTKSQTGTVDTQSSTTQQQTSQTSQQTNQAGTSQTTGSQIGQTSQNTSMFGEDVLSGLEGLVTDLFGSVGGGRPSISNFNVDEFVQNGIAAARANITDRIDSEVNQLMSSIGGSTSNNSMGALLANKLRNAGAAELSGVTANLTAQGEGINRENILAENALAQTDQGFLANLLQALKGGNTTTTGTEAVTTSQNQQTATTGSTTGTEVTTGSQQTSSTQTQNLMEQLEQLLSGTTNTVGTEHTKGTTKQSGGGLSLSL